jgi:hypothetical protein
MNDELDQLLDEAILLEKNVAGLYTLFQDTFAEDADFWRKLVEEERNHAALIRTVKDFFRSLGLVPSGLFSAPLEELRRSNAKVDNLIGRFRQTPPSRREACLTAVDLEELAGEMHFQKYMSGESAARIDDIFKELNRADKDHAQRIQSYLEGHDFEPKS